MMKRFLISVLCLGLAACGSNSNRPINYVPPPVVTPKPVSPVPVVPVAKPDHILEGENWSLKTPGDWKIIQAEGEPVIMLSADETILAYFTDEPFIGSYDAYGNLVLQQIAAQKATFMNISKITHKENEFIFARATVNTSVSLIWMTAQNGRGFGFVCGGATFDMNVEDACQKIFDSLNLK